MSLDDSMAEIVSKTVRDAVAPLQKQLEVIAEQLMRAPSSAEWLTPKEMAAEFRLQPETVREWVKKRRLPAKHFGRSIRIRRTDVENFLANTGAAETDEKVHALAERLRRMRAKAP